MLARRRPVLCYDSIAKPNAGLPRRIRLPQFCRPLAMTTPIDTIPPSQIDTLRNFAAAADLAALEKLAGDAAVSERGLQDFAGSPELARLYALIAKAQAQPNLLAIIGVQWSEAVHSNFLAWLLRPTANHRIGDYFLKNFLLLTGEPSEIDAVADWADAKVQTEWPCTVDGVDGRLDILVVNRSAQFLCAIENKILASEGGDQLTRYRKGLAAAYPNFTRRHIFLSPWGAASQWRTEQGYWTPLNYTAILGLVEQTANHNDLAIKDEVRIFLRQYAITLRRNIVPETTELQRLARKLYLKHREAIALINRHQPDWVPETKQILKEAVADQNAFLLDAEGKDWVGFRAAEWDGFPATQTGPDGDSSQPLLLFQFLFYNGKPWLELQLSPRTDETLRGKLLEAALQNPAAFRRILRELGSGWTRLHGESDYILDDADYGVGWDDGTSHAKIMAWVADFAENQFPAMNEVIVNCLCEHAAEQAQQPGQ